MADEKNSKEAWGTEDAVTLRNFLAQNPKIEKELRRRRPKVTGKTLEESAMTARDGNGYDLAMESIEAMCNTPSSHSPDIAFIES